MILAFLYHPSVRMLSPKKAEITLTPTWLGRWLRRRVRAGIATRAPDTEGDIHWWWTATDRCVGTYVERYIEAAPVLRIEDMTVEQLLLDEPIEQRRKRP
jgi:hypothetical protein